jgi:hypothetical protein
MEQVRFMSSIGNARANAYWESRLPPDFRRPDATRPYELANFIREKYIGKRWIAPGPAPGQPEIAPEVVVQSPEKGRRRAQLPKPVVRQPEGGTEISIDDLFDIEAARTPPPQRVKRVDGVSSAERKPGKKLPARLARKVKEPVERPKPASRASAPSLRTYYKPDDDDDPFA